MVVYRQTSQRWTEIGWEEVQRLRTGNRMSWLSRCPDIVKSPSAVSESGHKGGFCHHEKVFCWKTGHGLRAHHIQFCLGRFCVSAGSRTACVGSGKDSEASASPWNRFYTTEYRSKSSSGVHAAEGCRDHNPAAPFLGLAKFGGVLHDFAGQKSGLLRSLLCLRVHRVF